MKYEKVIIIKCKDRYTAKDIYNDIRWARPLYNWDIKNVLYERNDYLIDEKYPYSVYFKCTVEVRDKLIDRLSKSYTLINESRKDLWACE